MCVVCSAYIVQTVKRWFTRVSIVSLGIQPPGHVMDPPKPNDEPHVIDLEIRELERRVHQLRGMP